MPIYDQRESTQNISLFANKDVEPYYDLYKNHLIEINKIVLQHNVPLEGNLFYYHNSTFQKDRPEPARRHKRYNYAFFVQGGTRLLEIGFNAGHSALLALSGNSKLIYSGIDLARHPYTIPCFKYLDGVFGNRINLLIGDSRDQIPRMRDLAQFDIFHIDGGHGLNVAESDLCNVIERASPGARLLFDDVNTPELRVLCDHYVVRGKISEIKPSIWQGAEQALFRVL